MLLLNKLHNMDYKPKRKLDQKDENLKEVKRRK